MMILLLKVFADSSCQADVSQARVVALVAIAVASGLFVWGLYLKGKAVAQLSMLLISTYLVHFAVFMALWTPPLDANEQALLLMLREKPRMELAVTQAVEAHGSAITDVEARTAAVNAAQEGSAAFLEAKAALVAATTARDAARGDLVAARATLAPTRGALSMLLDDGVGGAQRVLDRATASLTAATTA
jgi:hypothetical protein